MQRFVDAIQSSLKAKNWYSALFLSLSLPDICTRLEDPSARNKTAYVRWWDQYMLQNYTRYIGADKKKHVFLHSMDAYLLRCSCLHEGSAEISKQQIRSTLDRFHFIAPPTWGTIHCNQMNSTLQLQIDIFCQQICAAVHQWLSDMKDNETVKENLSNLFEIHSSENGVTF